MSEVRRLLEQLKTDLFGRMSSMPAAQRICQLLSEYAADLIEGAQDEIREVCHDDDACVEGAQQAVDQAVERLCQMYQAQADEFLSMAQTELHNALRAYLYSVVAGSS